MTTEYEIDLRALQCRTAGPGGFKAAQAIINAIMELRRRAGTKRRDGSTRSRSAVEISRVRTTPKALRLVGGVSSA